MPWVAYPDHRVATVAEYERSDAKRFSNGGDAQYNPNLFKTDEQIKQLEKTCLQKGTLIKQSGNKHRTTMYMDANVEVGYCSGELTTYVFAEITSGSYHGRPISKKALRKLGVTI